MSMLMWTLWVISVVLLAVASWLNWDARRRYRWTEERTVERYEYAYRAKGLGLLAMSGVDQAEADATAARMGFDPATDRVKS